MAVMNKKYGFLILLPVLVACATNASAPSDAESTRSQSTRNADSFTIVSREITVERHGDTVIYRGSLTKDGLKAMRKAGLRAPVTSLLIDSASGEIVVS